MRWSFGEETSTASSLVPIGTQVALRVGVAPPIQLRSVGMTSQTKYSAVPVPTGQATPLRKYPTKSTPRLRQASR